MEDEATIPDSGTANAPLSNAEAVDKLAAIFDAPEASETEQAKGDVEAQPTNEVEANDAEAPEVETPEEQYFDVNGEQVSLKDLQNGYLRQSDYTRKTTELSEQRKHYEANLRDISQVRGEAIQQLEQLRAHLRAEFSAMEVPDFDWLAQNDPGEFIRQQNIWQKRQNSVAQVVQAESALKAKQAEYEKQQHETALQETSDKFFAKYPELREGNRALEAQIDMTKMLLDNGFTEEEISGINDFRIIDLLHQMAQAQKVKNSVAQSVEKMNAKPVLSQNNASAKRCNERNQSVSQFNKTKSSRDAISALEKLFG